MVEVGLAISIPTWKPTTISTLASSRTTRSFSGEHAQKMPWMLNIYINIFLSFLEVLIGSLEEGQNLEILLLVERWWKMNLLLFKQGWREGVLMERGHKVWKISY